MSRWLQVPSCSRYDWINYVVIRQFDRLCSGRPQFLCGNTPLRSWDAIYAVTGPFGHAMQLSLQRIHRILYGSVSEKFLANIIIIYKLSTSRKFRPKLSKF